MRAVETPLCRGESMGGIIEFFHLFFHPETLSTLTYQEIPLIQFITLTKMPILFENRLRRDPKIL